jgi:hypothetical protein
MRRKTPLALIVSLLLGVLVSGFTQKSPATLKVRDAVIKENAQTLRAKPGFEFVQEGKRIKVVERSTRRFVALSDGICGGGCSSCSALIDANGKTVCKGCNANAECKLSSAF